MKNLNSQNLNSEISEDSELYVTTFNSLTKKECPPNIAEYVATLLDSENKGETRIEDRSELDKLMIREAHLSLNS